MVDIKKQSGEDIATGIEAPKSPETQATPETPPSQDTAKIATDTQTQALEAIETVDYTQLLAKLTQTKNFQEFFDTAREGVNELLEQNPKFIDLVTFLLESAEGAISKETIEEAVKTNNFEAIQFAKGSGQYTTMLELTATKNDMIKELTTQALKENGGRLGLSKAEQVVIEQYLGMTSDMDEMYIKWRDEIYPSELLQEMEGAEDAGEYLKEKELDDPYSIVRNIDGNYRNVPYAVAFPEEYKKMLTKLDSTIAALQELPEEAVGPHMNRGKTLEYLNAYKTALSCTESRKEGDEWLSVKLWKEVDTKWVACQDRLQLTHAIETGYDETIDPAELRVIPEIKITMETVSRDTATLITKLKSETPQVLKEILGEENKDAAETIKNLPTSHVAIVTVITGGGNSMEMLGTAQLGPNYEDIQQTVGVKATIGGKCPTEALKTKLINSIFTEEDQTKWSLDDDRRRAYSNAEFYGGHELGHVYIGDMDRIDEMKSTWTGLVSTHEREKRGMLPEGTTATVVREITKDCIRYLTIEDINKYKREGIATIRIFLQTGLITMTPEGTFQFHEDKIDETCQEIERLWLEMTRSHAEGEKALEKWIDGQMERANNQEEFDKLQQKATDLTRD